LDDPPDPAYGPTVPSDPVVPKPAATVLLVRDHPRPAGTPLQVFLQRRVAGMAFAGGMTVFPGGGVDASDAGDPAAWSGPSPREWGERLDCDAQLAGALVQAAVREVFEECGVLLAGPGPVPAHERAELVAHRRTLAGILADAGLVLRSDLLTAWARWITPTQSPKRYDTAFFVARVPDGQEADAHTTEAVEAGWWYPSEALEHWQRGDMQLLAPTFTALRELDEHPDAATLLAAAARRVVRPVIPMVRREGDQVVVVLPGDPGFETSEMHLTPLSRASAGESTSVPGADA
jgi:8-oxo-dGTP pyrophosphatase MutT (NUDIX family)